MGSLLLGACVLAGPLAVTGCGTVKNKSRRISRAAGGLFPWGKKKEEEATPVRAPQPATGAVRLGEIAYVHKEQGFVLIRSNYSKRMVSGAEIQGHLTTGEEVCTLRCSPEYKRGFIVADIVSGDPVVGHIAYAPEASVRLSNDGTVDVPGGPTTGTSPIVPGVPSGDGQFSPDDLPPLPDFPID